MSVARASTSPPPFAGLQLPLVRRVVFAAFLAEVGLYLAWRLTVTLPEDASVWPWVFLGAEAYGFVTSLFFYLYVHLPGRKRPYRAPTRSHSVDVFITTYNEDVSIVRTTARAARDMELPHRTWILDDGRRPQMETMAAELGVGYLTRPDNRHYKAGNINAALERTEGELVLILDADHVPRRQLLARTVGHMEDPAVGLVQVPQVFHNLDSFQHMPSPRVNWHEASLFHHRIQNGADRFGTAFSVGTGGLIRRAALEELGGVPTGSVTEDIHMSMHLHAAGYRTVYVDQPLGYLLAPETPLAYHVQRLRWAEGSLQILRRDNPLLKKGLTPFLRLAYLNALIWPLAFVSYLVFFLSPALYLLGGISPMHAPPAVVVPVLAAHLLFQWGVLRLLGAPQAQPLKAEIFRMITLPTVIRSLPRFLWPEGLRFNVTPKGRHSGTPRATWAFLVAMLVLNGAGLVAAATRVLQGSSDPFGLAFSGFFCALFVLVAARALHQVLSKRDGSRLYLVPVSLEVQAWNDGDVFPVRLSGLGAEAADADVSLPMAPGERVELDLSAIGLRDPVVCQVSTQRHDQARLHFQDLSKQQVDRLQRYLYQTALPEHFRTLADVPAGPAPEPVSISASTRPTPTGEHPRPVPARERVA